MFVSAAKSWNESLQKKNSTRWFKLTLCFFKSGLAVQGGYIMYICVSLNRIAYDAKRTKIVYPCASASLFRNYAHQLRCWKPAFSPRRSVLKKILHLIFTSIVSWMYCNCFVWSFLETQTMQLFRLAVSSPACCGKHVHDKSISCMSTYIYVYQTSAIPPFPTGPPPLKRDISQTCWRFISNLW